MKRFKEAESDISAVLKHDAENLDARLLSAECHLIQRPGWISSVDLFALLHNVIQPLDKYLAMRPHDAKALRMRAHTRMLTGNPEGAESDWKEVVELHPMTRHPAPRGDVYRRRGNTAKAIEETDRVFSSSPDNLLAQLTRLEILADLHRWDEVVKASPQVFQIAPKDPRAVILYVTGLNIMDRPNDVLSLARELKGNEPARIAALERVNATSISVI
jgi:tetratricopeptide (TPR) repeat protein